MTATKKQKFYELAREIQGRNPGMMFSRAMFIAARRNPELHNQALAETVQDPRTAATIACGSRKLYRSKGRPEAEAALKREDALKAAVDNVTPTSTAGATPAQADGSGAEPFKMTWRDAVPPWPY